MNTIEELQAQRAEIDAQIAEASLSSMLGVQEILAQASFDQFVTDLTEAAKALPEGERGARYVNGILLALRTNRRMFADELMRLQVMVAQFQQTAQSA